MKLHPGLYPVLILVSACTPRAASEQEEDEAKLASRPVATVTVAGRSTADCAVQWNAQAMTMPQLSERLDATMHEAIEAIDGPQNLTEENTPRIRFEAGSQTPWVCVRFALNRVQAGGFNPLQIRPSDVTAAPFSTVQFPLEPPQAGGGPRALTIRGDGTMSWNGSPIRVRDFPVLAQMEGVGLDVDLSAEDDAPFRAVYETVGALEQAHIRAILPYCHWQTRTPQPPGTPLCS